MGSQTAKLEKGPYSPQLALSLLAACTRVLAFAAEDRILEEKIRSVLHESLDEVMRTPVHPST